MSLRNALERGEFIITSEVGPPKGTDVSEMLEVAETLRGRVHALNVTDNQAAVMRLCTLAACVHLKQAGHEPVQDRRIYAAQRPSAARGAAAVHAKAAAQRPWRQPGGRETVLAWASRQASVQARQKGLNAAEPPTRPRNPISRCYPATRGWFPAFSQGK